MRSWLGFALWCTLAACRFDLPKPSNDPPDGSGGPPNAGCTSFSVQLDTCKLTNAIGLMLSGDLTFDTDTGVLRNSMGIETPVVSTVADTLGGSVRVLVATSVTLAPNTRLRAVGVRGFAIVASAVITLQAGAVIDVSKGGAGYRGSCGAEAAAEGMADTSGGAGGGGGGFGAAGGDGGNGDSDNTSSTGGAAGKIAPTLPAGPLGGCPGAKGGTGDDPLNVGGAGGKGGGAAYLISAASIGISTGAGIDAGGGGGGGGTVMVNNGDSGGGGGGSGGSIFLEAPVIRSQGIFAANGGGGGEGAGGGNAGQAGAPGKFGIAKANGGKDGSDTGADGGDGGAATTAAGQQPGQLLAAGGGGGGGGVGVIRVKSADAQLGTDVSPAPQ